jgi:site-specific DNA-methyltransferase (adenine-specific)
MLIKADARHIPLKDKSVQCVVTSPPYWRLRDYRDPKQIGLEPTPEEYLASILDVSKELYRVLKDDGTLWMNLGDSYSSGTRNYNSFRRDKAPVCVPRISENTGLQPKNLIGIPWRIALAMQAQGWNLRSDIIWEKPNAQPGATIDRPLTSHEYIFLFSKSLKYFYNTNEMKEPAICAGLRSSARKGSFNGKTEEMAITGRNAFRAITEDRNIRSVWRFSTQKYSGAHFATFPREIPERCIKAGSRPGDVIFDPFVGSGTTVMVAQDLGRVGIGLDLAYQELAAERIGGTLFKQVVNSAFLSVSQIGGINGQ